MGVCEVIKATCIKGVHHGYAAVVKVCFCEALMIKGCLSEVVYVWCWQVSGYIVCVVMIHGRNVSTYMYLQLCTCAVFPMFRVSHSYSKRETSHSINSLVVGVGTCERTDHERGAWQPNVSYQHDKWSNPLQCRVAAMELLPVRTCTLMGGSQALYLSARWCTSLVLVSWSCVCGGSGRSCETWNRPTKKKTESKQVVFISSRIKGYCLSEALGIHSEYIGSQALLPVKIIQGFYDDRLMLDQGIYAE